MSITPKDSAKTGIFALTFLDWNTFRSLVGNFFQLFLQLDNLSNYLIDH